MAASEPLITATWKQATVVLAVAEMAARHLMAVFKLMGKMLLQTEALAVVVAHEWLLVRIMQPPVMVHPV